MLIDTILRSGLILILLYLAWFDLCTFLLPNKVTYPLIFLGLFINTLTPYAFCETTEAWIGGLVAYSSLYLINQIYRQLRDHDWLGIAALPFILLIASLLGIIGGLLWLRHHKLSSGHAFPFGPFLVIAGIIEVLWSSQFLNSLI